MITTKEDILILNFRMIAKSRSYVKTVKFYRRMLINDLADHTIILSDPSVEKHQGRIFINRGNALK